MEQDFSGTAPESSEFEGGGPRAGAASAIDLAGDTCGTDWILERLGQNLRLADLPSVQLAAISATVQRGIRKLAENNPQIADWKALLVRLPNWDGNRKHSTKLTPLSDATSEFLGVLVSQPSIRFSREEQQLCAAIGAHIFVAAGLGWMQIHADLSHGIGQIYYSQAPAWLALRRRNLASISDLGGLPASVTANGAAVGFVEQLRIALQNDLPSVEQLAPRSTTVPADRSDQEISSAREKLSSSAGVQSEVEPCQDVDTSPDWALFENQILRFHRSDLQNPNRLPFHWDFLSPMELRQSLLGLVDQLKQPTDQNNFSAKIHAAARVISLFAGLSLRSCWSLPIVRRGTLHVDLCTGIVRRRALIAAPRGWQSERLRTNGHWWRTPLPPQVTEPLIQVHAQHPRARTLGDLLQAVNLTPADCFHLLNRDWPTSHPPEDARFCNSFGQALLHLGVHPAMAARVSGNLGLTPIADHYYLCLPMSDVQAAVGKFCAWSGLEPPIASPSSKWIGSPKHMDVVEFTRWINALQKSVDEKRTRIHAKSDVRALIEFHNEYAVAVAIQLIWSVGGRGTATGRMTMERLFGHDDFAVVSDKRTDRYARERLAPITSSVHATRLHYIEHLRAIAAILNERGFSLESELNSLANGRAPHRCAFPLIRLVGNKEVVQAVLSNDLDRDLHRIFANSGITYRTGDFNRPRHFWSTQMVRAGTPQLLIDFLLGRHQSQSEPLGFAAGASAAELCEATQKFLEVDHANLGFRPLVGLGRTAPRYLRLPLLNVPASLEPTPNRFLRHKILLAEQILPDHFVQGQDPPVGPKSPAAATQLRKLAAAYVKSAVAMDHPSGALLFCLITFDLVVAVAELEALYQATTGSGFCSLGTVNVIESKVNEKIQFQRIISTWTSDIIALSRKRSVPWMGQQDAVIDFQQLICKLDSGWPTIDPDRSLALLCNLAAHWAAIYIAPATQFIALHKSPVIPARGLERQLTGASELHAHGVRHSRKSTRQKSDRSGWEPILSIVRHWADKDLPHGETRARTQGCILNLERWRESDLPDEYENFLIDLLVSDLSPDAPYRQLKISVLNDYAAGYSVYCSHLRREGVVELDDEAAAQAFADMGGTDPELSGRARWQMLHIAAFSASRGLWAPAAFLEKRGHKMSRVPRHPVYLSHNEVQTIGQIVAKKFGNLGGTYATGGTRLQLARTAPTRAAELRYLRPIDVDSISATIHITTSGHHHLKTESSRGSIWLDDKNLTKDLAQLRTLRQSFTTGNHSPLFADAHIDGMFDPVDEVTDALLDVGRQVTGNPAFRWHDLRAAAVTDLCTRLPGLLLALQNRSSQPTSLYSIWPDLTEKHLRFQWASRQARHASPLTTLRHYNAGGAADLHLHLNHAWSMVQPSYTYVAAMTDVKVHSLRVRHARRCQVGNCETDRHSALSDELFLFRERLLIRAATLDRSPPIHIEEESNSTASTAARLPQAILLRACGVSTVMASASMFLPEEVVEQRWHSIVNVAAFLKLSFRPVRGISLLSSLVRPPHHFQSLIDSLARDLTTISTSPDLKALDLAQALDKRGSGLIAREPNDVRCLLAFIEKFTSTKFTVWIQLRRGVMPNDCPGLLTYLKSGKVCLNPLAGQGPALARFRFDAHPVSNITNQQFDSTTMSSAPSVTIGPAPRSAGIAGRLLITGLLFILTERTVAHCQPN